MLKEKAAKVFIKKAESTESNRATVNFSKQVATTHAILKKANMR